MTPPETLDDLLAPVIRSRNLGAWCAVVGISPWTLLRLRKGMTARPHRGTLITMAIALAVPVERLKAAIAQVRPTNLE